MAIKMSSLEGELHAIGKSKPRANASKGHRLAIKIIREILPSTKIMEEVSVKISNVQKARQYLDIYLPDRDLVVEVHGRQHSEYVPHFHGTKRNFLRCQAADRAKNLWCELNDLELVELFHNETEDEWRDKIKRGIGR